MNPPAEMVAASPAGGHHVGFSRVAEAIRHAGGMPRMVLNFARRIALIVLPWLALGVSQAEDTFLPPKEAYKYTVEATQGDVVVHIDIQPGYYLYRDRLGLESATPGVTVGVPDFPVGEDHEDQYFGKQVIYRGPISVSAKLGFDGPPRPFDLTLKLQGCADAGLCYPPQRWTSPVEVAAADAVAPSAAVVSSVERKGFDLKQLLSGGPKSEGDFLPADQAFVLSSSSDSADRITLRWDIADGYYLYRDKVRIVSTDGSAQFGQPDIPGGKTEHDDYFGEQVIFVGEMQAHVPVAAKPGTREVALTVTYQGCAEAGLCYPPIKKQLTVQLAAPGTDAAASSRGATSRMQSEQDLLANKIRSGSLLAVLATFFGAGLLLAFTPCVLPMVPILSGIIVGAGRDRPVSRGRAFSLSVAYVLGMALTYTIAGAAFAAAGQQAQAFFQKPWIIVLFAALFVLLALGMFGVFNLQVPAAFQSRVADMSNRQKQGTLLGTAVMGALSSLIVTACVAPPLVAALAVIGQSGDVFRGGAALFALSLGMGAPLLLVGASAGRLLPKAGAWMDAVKVAFGVMMLGIAVWMVGRILPGPATLALWAVVAFVAGYYLFTLGNRDARGGATVVRRGLGALAVVYGLAMLVGALAGHSNPLQPLAGFGAPQQSVAANQLKFTRIKTVADLDRALAAARAADRPVMLDFYADWCVSCKEMEHLTFTDPAVQAALARATLLQADVTANDDADQALLQRFGILGPPTIVFFGPDGAERTDYRVVGFKPADEFRAHVTRAFGSGT
jgi:thiol:disulfide interchange protein DsbD